MIRIILSIVLLIHGLIHLLGFIVPWRLAEIKDLQYKTTVLAGKIDMGESGMKIIGILWLLTALAYVITVFGIFTLAPWWQTFTLWVTVVSLLITVLGIPDSVFGAVINVLIILYLLFAQKISFIPFPE